MIYKYYTDGAATMRKVNGEYVREAGGWAWARVDPETNKVLESVSGHKDNASNNEMELIAILSALTYYDIHFYDEKEADCVRIYSDSAYCVNIFTTWIKNWKANCWTRGKKHEPIKNLEIIKEIDRLVEKFSTGFRQVEFIKVPGHSNDEINNFVDKLAVEAKSYYVLKSDKSRDMTEHEQEVYDSILKENAEKTGIKMF